jgi:site-specific recombinase XerD
VDLHIRRSLSASSFHVDRTCNRYRSFISLCYREGQRDSKVKTNPARLIHSKAESRGRYRFLDRQTEYSMVAEKIAEQYPTRLRAFTFSVFSGARLSEQFYLRWPNVNFRDQEITFRDTKNGEDRTIPMNSIMLTILTELRAEHPKSKGTAFGELREFCCLPGAKLAEDVEDDGYSPKWFRDLCFDLGIEDYTWHNNRHTFCSWLAQDGASLKEIQELAGHKDIATTARYSHLSPDRRSSVMERRVTPLNVKVVEIRHATRTAIAG